MSLWSTHREPPPQNPMQFVTGNLWPWLTHYISVMLHRRHEIARHVFENRIGERVYRCEILVEVPLGESSFGADVNDSDGRDSPRSEELQAGIDQSLAALVTPVGGADATVWTRHGRDR